MADFVETNNTKTAVRELTVPFADITTFNTVVQSVLDDNPFGCVDYVQAGVAHDGVEKNKESYTTKILYEDIEGKTVGTISGKAPDVVAFGAVAAEIMANTDLATAMGGDAVRDSANESFSAQLKCYDATGEIYYVTFSRDSVRITSYQNDAIRTAVETWADTVPALA